MTDDVWKKHLAELYKDHSKKQKDKDAIGRLYAKTSAVPSFSKGASKTSSVSYLLSRKKS